MRNLEFNILLPAFQWKKCIQIAIIKLIAWLLDLDWFYTIVIQCIIGLSLHLCNKKVIAEDHHFSCPATFNLFLLLMGLCVFYSFLSFLKMFSSSVWSSTINKLFC